MLTNVTDIKIVLPPNIGIGIKKFCIGQALSNTHKNCFSLPSEKSRLERIKDRYRDCRADKVFSLLCELHS